MNVHTLSPEIAEPKNRLAFIINTINILTLSLVLLLVISWGAYLAFVGMPDSMNLSMDNLNQLPWLPYLALGISFVILPIVVESRRGYSLKEMGLLPGKNWLANIGWGFLVGIGWFLYAALLSGAKGNLTAVRDGSALGMITLLGNYLIVAFGEEILFRAFLQRRLSQVFSSAWAIIITGITFGLILHLSNPLGANLIFRVPAGVILGYLFCRRKTIWSPVAAHWLYNSMPTILAFLFNYN